MCLDLWKQRTNWHFLRLSRLPLLAFFFSYFDFHEFIFNIKASIFGDLILSSSRPINLVITNMNNYSDVKLDSELNQFSSCLDVALDRIELNKKIFSDTIGYLVRCQR